MEEKWVDIKGYEGLYKISNFGSVKSMPKKWTIGFGAVREKGETILNIFMPKQFDQYPCINITTGVGKQITKHIHRLLAEHFIPNPENKKCVNHKNGNKKDFSLGNLEWATRSEDRQHAYNTGLRTQAKGANNTSSKPILVIFLKEIKAISFPCINSAAKYLNISRLTIQNNLYNRFQSKNFKFELL